MPQRGPLGHPGAAGRCGGLVHGGVGCLRGHRWCPTCSGWRARGSAAAPCPVRAAAAAPAAATTPCLTAAAAGGSCPGCSLLSRRRGKATHCSGPVGIQPFLTVHVLCPVDPRPRSKQVVIITGYQPLARVPSRRTAHRPPTWRAIRRAPSPRACPRSEHPANQLQATAPTRAP